MFLNFNGELRREEGFLLRADNRGFRYGDGLFETMLLRRGKLRLGPYHLDRLAGGMRLLRLELPEFFSLDLLQKQVAELCARNDLQEDCRVRLTVFRGSGGNYNSPDSGAAYFLQASAFREAGPQAEGLTIGVFPNGRKACDPFAAIKSNNYLLSSMAGMYAREQDWDDSVLLNAFGRVAETAAANIWWVLQGRCHTPPISEGCVAGVMRRFLLEALPASGYEVREASLTPEVLAAAEEIFISNAIKGIQGVRIFQGRKYDLQLGLTLQRDIVQKI